MADFLSDLASKTGLEDSQAHQGIGALLTMLKSRLDPEAFSHLKNAIPDSEHMLASVADKVQSGGSGILDAMKNMAGKVFGGGAEDPAAALKSHLASVGLSTDHLKNLLPNLHDMLANKLPANVVAQIKEHLPGFSPSEQEPVEEEVAS
jgi:hypothetical protein